MAKFGNEERLPPFCHGYETTVTIDENNFDKTKISSLYLQDFGKLPTKLDKLLPSKIPFIGFFDNLSFTAISKDKNGYDFIKGWNGL
uniref:Uncharacterized protein n=1 Tax=Panagrolaimus superbus TaxID=310955 RepID=A0A914Y8Q6_9BILA